MPTTELNTNAEKRDFIGGLIATTIAKKGVDIVINRALKKVAQKDEVPMADTAVKPAKEEVVKELKEELQARAEHKLDIEPHYSSRNVIGVIFGLIGEGYILYSFWTDTIPQDFQRDVVPHLMVIAGLLTPLYSRFIAKKPLFR